MVKLTSIGGPQLAKALDQLTVKMSKKVMTDALVEGAEPIRSSMAANAPRGDEAPHIADNIVVSVVRGEEMATVAIGPAKGFAYGVPLELGTVDTAAQPFARPAFDGNVDRALKVTGDAAWRELGGQGRAQSSGGGLL